MTKLNPPMTAQMRNQRGIALLTVMLLLLITTVLGIAAITVTGLENRIAGFAMSSETAATAAESCLSTAVNVIQQTIDVAAVPTALLSNASPAGPVPLTNQTILMQEIMGQSDNNPDVAVGSGAAPNVVMVPNVGGLQVVADIDRLYAKAKSGGSLQFAAGAEGKGTAAEIDIFYRVDCVSQNVATGTTGHITAVYTCSASGDSCQRRPY